MDVPMILNLSAQIKEGLSKPYELERYWKLVQLYGKLDNAILSTEDHREICIDGHKSFSAKRELGQYPFIPFGVSSAIRYLGKMKQLLPKYKKIKFIDVGCGWGNICIIAKTVLDFEVYGIEYDLKSYEKAKEAGEAFGFEVFHGDAFQHDFSPYDFAYFFCPMHDRKKMAKLFYTVAKSMKSGFLAEMYMDYASELARILHKKRYDDTPCLYRKEGKEITPVDWT